MTPAANLSAVPRTIRQTVTLKTTPHAVYEALMDSRRHAKFSGAGARISRKVGGKFSVFDGYATGVNLALERDRKIVQTWRAEDWPAGLYSTVTFALARAGGGTRLIFTQAGVPDEQVTAVRQGWIDFYWTPLRGLFPGRSTARPAPRSRRR